MLDAQLSKLQFHIIKQIQDMSSYQARAKQHRDFIYRHIGAGYNSFWAKGITNDEANHYNATIRNPMLKHNDDLYNLVIELDHELSSLKYQHQALKNQKQNVTNELYYLKNNYAELQKRCNQLGNATKISPYSQSTYYPDLIKTVVHRGNDKWSELADAFCKKVNDSIPAQKIMCLSATLGNYDSSGILVAYGSQTAVHHNRTGKKLTWTVINHATSWAEFWESITGELKKFHPDSIVGLAITQTPAKTHTDCLAIIWTLK